MTDVVVVGGGNSAGQAVVYIAGEARKVVLVIRDDDLYKSMSSYLSRRIERTDNVEVLCNMEVRRMSGDKQVSAVEIVNNKTGKVRTLQAPALFSFIGATPRTDWQPQDIETDSRGFVRTGPTLAQSPRWTSHRELFLLETSRPGVFAAGDVRSGSVKRVASAVARGDGGPVRPPVPEGDVNRQRETWQSFHSGCQRPSGRRTSVGMQPTSSPRPAANVGSGIRPLLPRSAVGTEERRGPGVHRRLVDSPGRAERVTEVAEDSVTWAADGQCDGVEGPITILASSVLVATFLQHTLVIQFCDCINSQKNGLFTVANSKSELFREASYVRINFQTFDEVGNLGRGIGRRWKG